MTNLVAIVFTAALIFLFQAYGNWQRAALGLLLSFIALFLISFPLDLSFQELILRAKVRSFLAVISQREFDELISQGASLRSININVRENEALSVEAVIFAPRGSISRREIELIQISLSEKLNSSVNLKVRVIPFDILEYEAIDRKRS